MNKLFVDVEILITVSIFVALLFGVAMFFFPQFFVHGAGVSGVAVFPTHIP